MELSFDSPRGMRDFYPEDMILRNRVFDAWRGAAALSGFQPYDACVVESLELLQRKSGEEVSEQIYAFEDKSGRKLALRPEMTPTLARMVAARQGSLQFPIKWTTIAQCFRYERMTRGRKREHYQWNLDIVGEESVSAEGELLNTAVTAIRAMGIPDTAWYIHISSRLLLSELLAKLGIPESAHPGVFLALDKRGKIPDAEIAEIMRAGGVSEADTGKAFELLNLASLDAAAAILGPESKAVGQLREVFRTAELYGFSEILKFDIAVIRGLSYYTGIVFEAFDANRTLRAIFGGGRYDSLLTTIGGAATPAVGMGFGDVVVVELIKDIQKDVPKTSQAGTAIGFMFAEQREAAVKLARRFRETGTRVELMLAPIKPKQFFSRVGNGGFTEAIFIGPDDVASGRVQLKHLETREAESITL